MMEILIRFCKGYIKIEISQGNMERFLNMVMYKKINIWNITKDDNCAFFYIRIKDIYKLKPIIRKTKVSFKVKERYGLPFFLFSNRKRKIFFIGIFIGWLIVYVMSLYVWNISFEGNSKHTDEELARFLKDIHIDEGIKIRDVDGELIEKELRNEFFDITWASVDITGTKLTICVRENINKIENLEEALKGNLIAAKSAEVVSIITRSGKPMVKAGDIVEKGTILISGKYELYKDDMTVLNEKTVRADGDVIGKVTYYIDEIIDRKYIHKEYTGNEYELDKGYIGDYSIENRFDFGTKKYKKYDIYVSNSQLVIGDSFYLPVFTEKKIYKEYTEKEDFYTDEQLEQIADKKIMYKIKKIEENTIQILEKNVKIEVNDDLCRIYGQVTVLEYIGVVGGTYE